MTKLAPSREQRCPACGGRFTVTSPAKKKKIQCPRCRAIVSATNPALFEQSEARGSNLAIAPEPEWKTQCELLRTRIERLESQMESLLCSGPQVPAAPPDEVHARYAAAAAPSEEISFPNGPSELAGLRNESASSGTERQPVGSKELEELSLLATCDDAGSVRVIEMLTSVLTEAGWKIRRGLHVGNGAGASPGLTLIASPALCRKRLSRTFTALSAAGFSVTLRLDQNLAPHETTLFVGHSVEYRSEDASERERPAIAEVA